MSIANEISPLDGEIVDDDVNTQWGSTVNMPYSPIIYQRAYQSKTNSSMYFPFEEDAEESERTKALQDVIDYDTRNSPLIPTTEAINNELKQSNILVFYSYIGQDYDNIKNKIKQSISLEKYIGLIDTDKLDAIPFGDPTDIEYSNNSKQAIKEIYNTSDNIEIKVPMIYNGKRSVLQKLIKQINNNFETALPIKDVVDMDYTIFEYDYNKIEQSWELISKRNQN